MAALVERDSTVVQALQAKLVAPSTSLPQKYRVLFSLRGIAGEEAHAAMLQGECRRRPAPVLAGARPPQLGEELRTLCSMPLQRRTPPN